MRCAAKHFYDREGQPVFEPAIFKHIVKLVAQHGSQIWWEWPNEKLVPTAWTERAKSWKKETDIMDVWFDSGTSFRLPSLNGRPADLCLEGADQFRGWFNSSLVNSVAFANQTPFKKIISHGFVLDQRGVKMAKSLGNVIDPAKIVARYGAEILRLWVALSEYGADVSVSEPILEQVATFYRGLRSKLNLCSAFCLTLFESPRPNRITAN
ncbi:class I tRNA ligase family protein [Mycoplasma sp. ATU-Cv-508]|uniref:class I tRNA ligase family protein n=1 Tax=Mycoplasma sp. ATU-Cv-508 TaxID=2048001 RepID=UPI000FDE9244